MKMQYTLMYGWNIWYQRNVKVISFGNKNPMTFAKSNILGYFGQEIERFEKMFALGFVIIFFCETIKIKHQCCYFGTLYPQIL